MFKVITRDICYVGLELVVDVKTRERSWASTAIFVPFRMIYGSASTPQAALENLVTIALAENLPPPLAASVPLAPIAGDLLQLVVRRSDSTPDASSWTATGKFRRRGLWGLPRTVVVTAAEADEAIEGLILQATGQLCR